MKAADRAIYASVARRASGLCESCGRELDPARGVRDHARGRGRMHSVESVWLICPPCDTARHHGPAVEWLERFARHCVTHGYREMRAWADARIAFVNAKTQLGANL